MPWGSIHDLHVGVNGNFWVQQGISTVAEIDPETKKVIWSYESAVSNGNQGKRVEVHSFQPLDDDRIMIAESGPARVIEINRKGELLAEMRLTVDHPDAHSDTRLVRKLPTGAYLVCHERDGVVREYDSDSGAVMWSYEIPLFGKPRKDGHGPEAFGNKVFGALRLTNGNTLIATGNGHSVIEVTPDREIVWKIEQNDLPGVRLAWVTTLEVTAQGTYVVGNCHAGPKQPLLVEVDPKTKKVVATFDRFDELGNSVSNSKLLAAPKRTS
jgi:outer membrane protein assembly factor BamB